MNSIVALPLVAVPTASPLLARAAPDRRALHAYASWLFMERRILCGELWPHVENAEDFDWADNPGFYWHCEGPVSWRDKPQPSSRAAAVLDMIGVDWQAPAEKYDCGLNHTDTGERHELPADWPRVDSELSQASTNVGIMAMALDGLPAEHPQYDEIFESYQRSIDVLSDNPARTVFGLEDKASAIRNLKDDDEAIAIIARSLARDIMERPHLTREPKTM